VSVDVVIAVSGVTKRFRRYRALAPHTTLKTAFVEWLRHWRAAHDRLTDPNRFDVLRDVTFTAHRGESVGLIGRNGAGKSTLLKMLAGIYKPDAGTIAVHGRVAALIELGAGFHPDFTGRENVLFNGIILGLSKQEIQARFDRILAFADIGDFIDAPVRTYSSGMFMRLAFSVALYVEPDILLVDEILAVGDETFQNKCLVEMERRITSGGQTTVIVSHDLGMIERLCTKLVLLDPPQAKVYSCVSEGISEFRRLLASPA
jgi:lipopolysaccharide transport system ATP-binding protein